MKFRKLTELPDEYIVKCGKANKCNEVLTYYYNRRSTIVSDWEYIICKNDLNSGSGDTIEHYIRGEYKHLPVFTFEQWEQLKQQTENLNKMENKTEINSIKIPAGLEFDRVENGIIKLKPIAKKLLTHKEILDAESGEFGVRLICNGLSETTLSSNSGSYLTDCVSRKDAERVRAFVSLMRIAAYYNKHYANGWVADCNDRDQAKFRVAYDAKSKSYTVYVSFDSSFGNPAFATKELAEMALANNREIFDNYLK